jgi:hypothetical protein
MAKEPAAEPKKVSVNSILSKDSKSAPKPKSESKSESKSKDGKKTRKHKHTHIEHHDDGSHTVRHTPVDGGQEVSYSKPDLDGVHDGLEEHIGDPNADEEQAEPAAEAAAEPPAEAQMPRKGM